MINWPSPQQHSPFRSIVTQHGCNSERDKRAGWTTSAAVTDERRCSICARRRRAGLRPTGGRLHGNLGSAEFAALHRLSHFGYHPAGCSDGWAYALRLAASAERGYIAGRSARAGARLRDGLVEPECAGAPSLGSFIVWFVERNVDLCAGVFAAQTTGTSCVRKDASS